MLALPSGQLLRLVLRKAGFHGKLSFRKIERFLQFEWLGHGSIGSILFFCPSVPSSMSRGETSEGSVITYVTLNGKQVSARRGCNQSGPARIVPAIPPYCGYL